MCCHSCITQRQLRPAAWLERRGRVAGMSSRSAPCGNPFLHVTSVRRPECQGGAGGGGGCVWPAQRGHDAACLEDASPSLPSRHRCIAWHQSDAGGGGRGARATRRGRNPGLCGALAKPSLDILLKVIVVYQGDAGGGGRGAWAARRSCDAAPHGALAVQPHSRETGDCLHRAAQQRHPGRRLQVIPYKYTETLQGKRSLRCSHNVSRAPALVC